jgi:hypothetical protein
VKPYHQPSGLLQGLELLIDPHWSPQQVLAVFDLIDDLRDRIWAHYERTLTNQFREIIVTHNDFDISDPPF